MENLFDDMDVTTLRQLVITKATSLSSETDETKKTALTNEIEVIKKSLAKAVKEENRVKAETTVSLNESKTVSTEKQHAHREIMSSLAAVPEFGSGNDVHVHVNKLANLYDLYVKGRDDENKLEETFVRNCKKLLCDSYLTQLINSNETLNTFEEYKDYMYRVHESKEHHFQRLNALWSIMPKERESFTDLGSRLENQAHEVRLSILAQWKKGHSDAKDIPSKDLFDLIAGQILLSHIQSSKNRHVYQYMANDLDKAWTVKDVANRAMTIADRVKSDNVDLGSFHVGSDLASVTQPGGGDVSTKGKKSARRFYPKKAQPKPKVKPSKDKDCWFFMDGHCKKGDGCPWKHDPLKKGIGRPDKSEIESSSLVAQSYKSTCSIVPESYQSFQ